MRELEHLIMQMSVFSRTDMMDMSDLPETYTQMESESAEYLDQEKTLPERLLTLEIQILRDSLARHSGHQQNMAETLGIPRTTLRSKLIKYGLLDASLED